jgi:hypothetical protein
VFDRARDPEFIPNNPRFGWIPVLPAKTPESVLSRFQRILRPGDCPTVDAAKELMNEYFPAVDRGDAWSTAAGSLLFAVNTHENWYVPEPVKLIAPRRPDGLSLEQTANSAVLRWTHHEGDRAYNVWRLRDRVETCLTPQPIADPIYRMDHVEAGDEFAVSALTDAKESFEGTLHLHQFVILNRFESRRSVWVRLSGERTDHPRFAEIIPRETDEIRVAVARTAECTPVEDLVSPVVSADDRFAAEKREVMQAMIAWKAAIESEEITRILKFYLDDYREADGRTTESVQVAFRNLFRRYVMDRFEPFISEWGALPGWQFPALRLFVREWKSVSQQSVEVSAIAHLWAGGGPEMEPSDMIIIPFGRPSLTTMTWKRTPDGWKLAATNPAFLQVEDTAVFRFRYQGW